MTTQAFEVNFDGLVGITHCFGGLAPGNLPSMDNEGHVSNPKLAALQGLNKMKFLASLGIHQAVLPPQERPHLPTLRRLGFEGTNFDILSSTKKVCPWLVPQVSSSGSMWTANAATISPSIDSSDSHLHLTPANLATYFHRSMEAETTSRILRAIFPNSVYFEHHAPLPSAEFFFDEGAANHTRFCKTYGSPGFQFFTYGRCAHDPEQDYTKPKKYLARQTKEASETVARLHKLYPGHALFASQSPSAIDEGAFHYDLLGVGNQNVLLIHEKALWKQLETLDKLKKEVLRVCNTELIIIEVKESQISIKEALKSYFFNSQLVTLNDGMMCLIAPESCQNFGSVNAFLNDILTDNNNPIGQVQFVDLSESLKNGGGPACLRLRVVLNVTELAEINPGILLTDQLYLELSNHIQKYYPEQMTLADLSNPKTYERSCESLDTLSKILKLGGIYSFQV